MTELQILEQRFKEFKLDRALKYIEKGRFNQEGLLEECQAWSSSEKIIVKLLIDLYNQSQRVVLIDLISILGRENLNKVIKILQEV